MYYIRINCITGLFPSRIASNLKNVYKHTCLSALLRQLLPSENNGKKDLRGIMAALLTSYAITIVSD